MDEISQMLDQLAEIQAQLEVLRLNKETAINEALPPEVRQALADIEAEYGAKVEAATLNADELAGRIKAAALAHGKSVKGTRLQAVVVAGRVTWDTKSLDGYMAAHPEICGFRKEGEPSVQIRVRK